MLKDTERVMHDRGKKVRDIAPLVWHVALPIASANTEFYYFSFRYIDHELMALKGVVSVTRSVCVHRIIHVKSNDKSLSVMAKHLCRIM